MQSSARNRILFLVLAGLICSSAATAVSAQEARAYHYQGRLIDLEVVPDRIAVHFHGGMDLEGVLDAVQAEGLRVARTEVIPALQMAILTLGQEEAYTTFQQQLTGLPEVLCVAPLYASGTATCTTRDTVVACFSKDIPDDVRRAVAFRAGARIVRVFPGLEGWVQLRCLEPAERDPFEVAAALLEVPGVLHAHPDFIHLVPKCAVPDDTHFSKQWALNKIDAPRGWDLHTGDASIVIAVLDDGVDTQHEDLAAKIVSPYDATDGNTNQEPNAWDGHGTACAGIAAAVTNNGKGVAGVSWKSKIMPVRIGYSLQSTPGILVTKSEWLGLGILMASQQGADVLSNSWGGMAPTDFVTVAIQNVRTTGRGGRGCTLVFPTGNGDKQGVQYPATLAEVIAVGATDENDSRVTGGSWGSNYGTEIDVVAPGINLWTTDITGKTAGYNKGGTYDPTGNYYNAFGGTSAAVPHVAGLAALILARNPGLSPAAIQDVIQKSADDLGPAGKDIYTGYGRINVDKALQEVRFIPVRDTIAQDTTWTAGHVYLIENTVTVASTVTLTIDPGVVVKFAYQKGILDVSGDMKLPAAPAQEVVFTSERDDSYGGDTNGDGKATSPAPGDWACVIVRKNGTTLQNARFRFGGHDTWVLGMVWPSGTNGCSPDIKDCRFEHARTAGLYYQAYATEPFEVSGNTFDTCPTAFTVENTIGQGRFHGNTIKNCSGYPVLLQDGAMVDFQNNTLVNTKNTVIAVIGTISKNVTWKKIFFGTTEMPYLGIHAASLTVSANATLTIDPEVVVKFNYHDGSLHVRGDLDILGTEGKEVVFTSDRDDEYGGDSNGDGTGTKPAPGDWQWVVLENSNTKIEHAIFRYGGYHSTTPGMVIASNGCSPAFTDCRFEHAREVGLYYHADPSVMSTISRNTFDSCPTAVTFQNTHAAFNRFFENTIENSAGYPVCLVDGVMVDFGTSNKLTNTANRVVAVYGNISKNVTWKKVAFGTVELPFLIAEKCVSSVIENVVLTIDPDVVVKFRYFDTCLHIKGDLKLLGTAGKEVVFTSERDDEYGGDSNGDGDRTKPAPGDWYDVVFYNSKTVVQNAIFRYGGRGDVGIVWAQNCSPTFTSCRFEHARVLGLLYEADPNEAFTLTDNRFTACPTAIRFRNTNHASKIVGTTVTGSTSYPFELVDGAMVGFENTSLVSTPNRVIAVSGTKVEKSVTWNKVTFGTTEIPYLVSGALHVNAGATLTIDAGVVVKFWYQCGYMNVYGDLKLNSTKGNEVVFTSDRDDEYGGDSNGDGNLTRPAPDDWYHVYFQNPGQGSDFHHAVVRYGGYASTTKGMVWVNGCSPDIRDCLLEHVRNNGLWYDGDPQRAATISDNVFDVYNTAMVLVNVDPANVVKGNTITGSTYYPVQLLDGAMADFQNNTITNSVHKVIAVSGIVGENITWKPIRFGSTVMPYLVNGDLTVEGKTTLTIEAGVIVKHRYQNGRLQANGDLKLNSSPGKEVVFTSERDDEYGGDSNGDGYKTWPAPGDWKWVGLNTGTSPLHDAVFRYGGHETENDKGLVWIAGCSPDIIRCRFEYAKYCGLYYHADEKKSFVVSGNTFFRCPNAIGLNNTHPASEVKGNTFEGCTWSPIHLFDGAAVVFQGNVMVNCVQKCIGVTGTIRGDTTWHRASIGTIPVPYIIWNTLTVNPAVTLTIDPGVVVKFSQNDRSSLLVRGDLKLLGDRGNPAVFTSDRDDDHGGDSNGDGRSTMPAAGDWGYIGLYNSNISFENALLRYGGYGTEGMLWVNNCSPTVRNCRFEHAGNNALRYCPDPNRISFPLIENNQVLDGSGVDIVDSPSMLANVTMKNCHINTHAGEGLELHNLNSRSLIEGVTVRGSSHGISLANARPTIRNSIIHNSGSVGIYERDSGSDPVLDHNCIFGNAGGQYHDHDTATTLNTAAAINALNPPASNTGNIVADPLFVKGPQGNYYLSHTATGHVQDSPCIDHGNPVEPKNVVHGTTRIDHYQDTGKPDLGYHHAMDLDADVYSIDVSRQGQVNLHLAAGGKNAGRQYLIGCSLSGSVPGTELGGLQVPLNLDPVTLIVIPLYGSPMFVDFSGFLDGNGTARPVFDTLGPNPGLKGLTLTMAAVLPFHYASNPVDIEFR